MDLLDRLYAEMLTNEPFKAAVVVCIILALAFIYREVRRLKADFDKHVTEEGVTLAALTEALKSAREARIEESKVLSETLGEMKDDIRLILSVLLPATRVAKGDNHK